MDIIKTVGLAISIIMISLSFFLFFVFSINNQKLRDSFGSGGKSFSKVMSFIGAVLKQASVFFTPKRDSDSTASICDWYERFLLYTSLEVQEFFDIKNALFAGGIMFLIAVKMTDMTVYSDELFKRVDIKDPMYESMDLTDAEKEFFVSEKKRLYDLVLASTSAETFAMLTDEQCINVILVKVRSDLKKNYEFDRTEKVSLVIADDKRVPAELVAKDILFKIKELARINSVNFGGILLTALLLYILPEFIVAFINFFNKSSASAEKRFMKRLIIMNGSIKPTDFMMVLSELIDKSKYFKKMLKDIEDSNKKNYEDNTRIYAKYIKESNDLETKLFYEKLDEANNYDFDQAILNIKNEFVLEKRMQVRKTKQAVEMIHVWGLVGFMVLILLVMFYLLRPWLDIYDMGQMM